MQGDPLWHPNTKSPGNRNAFNFVMPVSPVYLTVCLVQTPKTLGPRGWQLAIAVEHLPQRASDAICRKRTAHDLPGIGC